MGKNQHSKDRMFVTATEQKMLYGGKSIMREKQFARLPFNCCALSLAPFETPVCTPEGHVFDLVNIVPFLRKHKTNPVTGKALSPKDLIHLKFHKNQEGKYFDPITYKEFSDNTYLVAIRPSGNVFSYDVVKELNVKQKNFNDLLTGEKFTKADIITIQDPQHPEQREISNFEHLKKARSSTETAEEAKQGVRASTSTQRVLDQLSKWKDEKRKRETGEIELTEKEKIAASLYHKSLPQEPVEPAGKKSKLVYSQFTTNKVSGSLTSTTMAPVTRNQFAVASDAELLERRWQEVRNMKTKGYVRLETNFGAINLELHCDMVPRTCDNFLGLCEKEYYHGVLFHRVIKNFMVQGGDPTGTGRGGESIWGKPFKDEYDSRLLHDSRGVLSMANSGPNTNGSQFFITFKSAKHLDYKHSVFGRVVGGLEVLASIESLATDDQDRPLESVKFIKTTVFANPFREWEEKEVASSDEEEKAAALKQKEENEENRKWFSNPAPSTAGAQEKRVGKYLKANMPASNEAIPASVDAPPAPIPSKKPVATTQFKDFSSW